MGVVNVIRPLLASRQRRDVLLALTATECSLDEAAVEVVRCQKIAEERGRKIEAMKKVLDALEVEMPAINRKE